MELGVAGGSFLKHIATKTGAQVELAGRGSGTAESDQPLHILVTSSSQDSRDAAVRHVPQSEVAHSQVLCNLWCYNLDQRHQSS